MLVVLTALLTTRKSFLFEAGASQKRGGRSGGGHLSSAVKPAPPSGSLSLILRQVTIGLGLFRQLTAVLNSYSGFSVRWTSFSANPLQTLTVTWVMNAEYDCELRLDTFSLL